MYVIIHHKWCVAWYEYLFGADSYFRSQFPTLIIEGDPRQASLMSWTNLHYCIIVAHRGKLPNIQEYPLLRTSLPCSIILLQILFTSIKILGMVELFHCDGNWQHSRAFEALGAIVSLWSATCSCHINSLPNKRYFVDIYDENSQGLRVKIHLWETYWTGE